MSEFATKAVGGRNPSLHDDRSEVSTGTPFLPGRGPGAAVTLLGPLVEGDPWIEVSRQPPFSAVLTGWMLKQHIDAPVPDAEGLPIDRQEFVRFCGRLELAGSTGGGVAIAADYLIALGLLESGLTIAGARQAGGSGMGPFQFDAVRWAEVAATEGLGPMDRIGPLDQAKAANAIALRDRVEYSRVAGPNGAAAPDGPLVPTYLNLFHAWLLGVSAAAAVDAAGAAATGAMRGLIVQHGGNATGLFASRPEYLMVAGQEASIGAFVQATTAALDKALEDAGVLLVQFFPEMLAAAVSAGTSGTAPWLDIAEREEKAWREQAITPTSAEGATRIRSYFAATDHGISATEPWCGAFVAYCLAQSGSARVQGSVVKGSARAANWASWGDLDLGRGADAFGRTGAVVVMGRSATSGPSGHVTFSTGRLDGAGRLECLGGNQGGRVTVSLFPTSGIVAVRWLDTADALGAAPDAAEHDSGIGAPLGASEDDIITMARTIYGEARGELGGVGLIGLEAVAAVIMNRVRLPGFPKTVTGVCLQRKQFSCWNAKDPNRARIINLGPNDNSEIKACTEVTRRAVAGLLVDPTGGAAHYHSASLPRPDWVRASPGATSKIIGNHIFYCGIR